MIEYRAFLLTIQINETDSSKPHFDFLFEPDVPYEWGKNPEIMNLNTLAYHNWEVLAIFNVADYGKVALCKRKN